jgi:glycosyltransferase involved in cell wall biosynthesis
MSADTILYLASFGWLGAKLLANLADVIGTSLYAIRQTQRLKYMRRYPHSRRLRQRPLVSVVVYAHNMEETIGACLDSLRRSRYRKLEIVVAEYGSRDATRQVVRSFISAHPRLHIRLVAKRTEPTTWHALVSRQLVHGELVAYLNGQQAVDPTMIQRAVAHFAVQEEAVLVPAVEVRARPSLLSLIQQYGSLQASMADQLGIWGDRQRSFMIRASHHASKGNLSAYYGDDVVIQETPASSYWPYLRSRFRKSPVLAASIKTSATLHGHWRANLRRIVVVIRHGVYISEPIVIAYFGYLALFAFSPQPLILAWILSVGNWLFSISISHRTALRRKVWLALLTPGLQSLLFVLPSKQMLRVATTRYQTSRWRSV